MCWIRGKMSIMKMTKLWIRSQPSNWAAFQTKTCVWFNRLYPIRLNRSDKTSFFCFVVHTRQKPPDIAIGFAESVRTNTHTHTHHPVVSGYQAGLLVRNRGPVRRSEMLTDRPSVWWGGGAWEGCGGVVVFLLGSAAWALTSHTLHEFT